MPVSAHEQGGMGGGCGGGRGCGAGDSNNPSGSSSSNGGGVGVAGTDTLKAVLELGERDAVKRLLRKARTK